MIALVAAVSKNGAIGKNGKLPAFLPSDLSFFKKLTSGHIVVFGRKTFETLPHALSDRIVIVVSNTKSFQDKNLFTAHSVSESVSLAKRIDKTKNLFFAGGERIYRDALPLAEKLFLTELQNAFDGDAFFPAFEKELFFRKTLFRAFENGVSYEINEYTKRA